MRFYKLNFVDLEADGPKSVEFSAREADATEIFKAFYESRSQVTIETFGDTPCKPS